MKNGLVKWLAGVCLAVACFGGSAWAYTVTYDLNCSSCTVIVNGSEVTTIDAGTTDNDGNLQGFLPEPTREDYKFDGWFTAATGGDPVTALHTYSSNITIYARWTLKVFTIVYNLNYTGAPTLSPGSAQTSSVPATVGRLTTALPTPTRDDYAFNGWFTAATEGTQVKAVGTDEEGYKFSGDPAIQITIYAQWTLKIFTVTFNLNYTTDASPPESVQTSDDPTTAGRLTAALPTPIRADYTFNGWFTAPTGGVQVTPGPSGYKFTGAAAIPVTIYAQWTLNIFTITFNLNYPDAPTPPTAVTTSNVPATAGKLTTALPTLIRTGYTFNGWFTAATEGTQVKAVGTDEGGYKFSGDPAIQITIYAQWTATDYTVSFNLSGGNGDVPSSITAHYGDKLTLPFTTDFTKSGYINDGKWHTRGVGTSTSNTVVLAENFEAGANGWVPVNGDGEGEQTNKWMISSVDTVTKNSGYYSAYISNDNSTNAYTATSSSIVHLYKEIAFPESSTPFTLTFYTKVGGDANDVLAVKYKEGEGTPGAGLQFGTSLVPYNSIFNWGQQSITLPVIFSGKTIKLVFTWANNNSGDAQPPAAIDDIRITGTVVVYSYPDFTNQTSVTGNTDLYLKWVPQYTVRFNPNGGLVDTEYDTTGADSTLASLPTPTRDDGYAFAGWFTTPAATGGTEITSTTKITANATLFARWIINPTVSFDLNGGTGEAPEPISIAYNATIPLEQKPSTAGFTKAGYVNDGEWYAFTAGNPSINILNEDFEGTSVGWTFVNGTQTNTWIRGTSTAYAGSYSAYITNNGSANSYTVSSSSNSIVHLYRDITFPVSSSPFTLTFYFKGAGESCCDNMTVKFVETSATLTAGSTVSGTALGTYNGNSSWTVKTITLPATTYSGTTKRLVFTWINDTSVGTQPPAAIDNISITGSTSDVYTPFVFGETGTQVKGDTTLYLKWVSSYTVTFNPNGTGGTVTPTSATTRADGKLDSLPTPERAGYDFTGWYTTPAGTVTVSADRVYTAATTIYAHWTPAQYTIAYTLAGGTVATANPATYNIESASFTLNNPTRTGYTFAGWTGSNGETPQTAVSIATGSTGNKEYTANWTPVQYTITYDLAGGTLATDNPATYNIESDAIALNNPTREGYTFAGWTGGNGTTPQTTVSIATGSTGNKTYTANWTQNPIVSFNLNGGTGTIPSSISTAYGTTLTAEQKPSTAGIGKSGYANDGIWYTRATVGTPTSTTIFSETFEDGAEGWVFVNGTQTNKWTIGTATAYAGTHSAYISDDESTYSYSRNATSIVHLYKDIEFPESNTNFTLTYYFRGVGETSSDYMIISYGQTNSTPVAGETFGTELATAVNFSGWTSRTVTLPAANFSGRTIRLVFTWRNDNFLGNIPPAAIDNIAITGTPGNYTYTPFIFGGENATVITRDTTLYLKWFPAYTVSFNSNGGSGISPYYVFSNIGLLDSLPTPIREGYAFEGWFTAAKNGTQITKNTPLTSDTTIYAHWTKEITPIMPQIAIGNQILQTKNGINLAAKTNAIIEVYNLSGKLVSKQSYVAGNHSISLSHLPKGMYIVRARFAGVAHSTAAETLRLTIQ